MRGSYFKIYCNTCTGKVKEHLIPGVPAEGLKIIFISSAFFIAFGGLRGAEAEGIDDSLISYAYSNFGNRS